MPNIWFLLAELVFGLIAVLICKNLAADFKIIDSPDGNLKQHKEPIPATGGLAIFLTALFGMLIYDTYSLSKNHIIPIVFLVSLFIMGFLDDKYNLGVLVRLSIQILLSILLTSSLQTIPITNQVSLDFIFTVIFCVACINALNMVDIMDGLAAGIAFFAILNYLLLINAQSNFYPALAVCTLVALIPFLIFNFHPAKIYMGDMGSTTLGGLIALLSLSLFEQASSFSNVVHYGIMVIVIFFELTFIVIVRLSKGLNPFKGSPDHIPLRIKHFGFSTKQTVFIIYIFSATVMLLSITASKLEISAYIMLPVITIFLYSVGKQLLKVSVEKLN